jgi:hypothetical protein
MLVTSSTTKTTTIQHCVFPVSLMIRGNKLSSEWSMEYKEPSKIYHRFNKPRDDSDIANGIYKAKNFTAAWSYKIPYRMNGILVTLLQGKARFEKVHLITWWWLQPCTDNKNNNDTTLFFLVPLMIRANKLGSSECTIQVKIKSSRSITKFSPQMVYHQVQLSNCCMGRLLGSARKNMTSISKTTRYPKRSRRNNIYFGDQNHKVYASSSDIGQSAIFFSGKVQQRTATCTRTYFTK